MNYYTRCEWYPSTDRVTYGEPHPQPHQQPQNFNPQPQMQFWEQTISPPGYHSTLEGINDINDYDMMNERMDVHPPSSSSDREFGEFNPLTPFQLNSSTFPIPP